MAETLRLTAKEVYEIVYHRKFNPKSNEMQNIESYLPTRWKEIASAQLRLVVDKAKEREAFYANGNVDVIRMSNYFRDLEALVGE